MLANDASLEPPRHIHESYQSGIARIFLYKFGIQPWNVKGSDLQRGCSSMCRMIGTDMVTMQPSLFWYWELTTLPTVSNDTENTSISPHKRQRIDIIKRCFTGLMQTKGSNTIPGYTGRPILEYGSRVWNPNLARDTNAIEKVHDRCAGFTSRPLILQKLRLADRRRQTDMCDGYKYMHDLDKNNPFSLSQTKHQLRGHSNNWKKNFCHTTYPLLAVLQHPGGKRLEQPTRRRDLRTFPCLLQTKIEPDSKVHGAHLGPTGPRWAPCWPQELCSLGRSLPIGEEG